MAALRAGFARFACAAAEACGSPVAFGLSVGFVLLWAAVGPWFGFSDSWQLVANTTTTIITFILGFLIIATQVREGRVTQLKLDELIRSVDAARDQIVLAGDWTPDELEAAVREVHEDVDDRRG